MRTDSAKTLLADLARFPRSPLVVFTGGDPLKRPDVFELLDHSRAMGLLTAMTPSATPLVTRDAVFRFKQAGLDRLAISLDAADAATHDAFRRVRGSFARTLDILRDAADAGLPAQINTTVTRHNLDQLDRIADVLAGLQICLWSVFFLVPTGRATDDQRLTADEVERVFETLYRQARRQPYPIKSTEAPHYRRYVVQQNTQHRRTRSGVAQIPPFAQIGTNDGKGVAFVSHTGEIYPSGFLPVRCGCFPEDSIVDVYQRHPLFVSLRDATQLQGKCGACEYREICGGSRARAHAVHGHPLAEEPDCAYTPARSATSPNAT
ncbi:MAG TPA: radical SAM protein [Tepidisphaeraceae bacterium]